jgi:glycerophosphoryl diester phosphodiesterase
MRRHRAVPLLLTGCLLAAGCSSKAATTSATTATAVASTDAVASVSPVTSTTVAVTSTAAATTTTEAAATTTTVAAAKAATIKDLLALKRPIVLAHAGGEDQFPHSTLFAFGESMKANVDMLDLDVQLTKDNVLIVQHDDDVTRQTESTAKVADLTFEQINALDNAYWFTADCVCKDRPDTAYIYRGIRTGVKATPAGYAPADFAIPRFSDLVKKYPTTPLNIEIKGQGADAFPAAAELAKELTELGRLDGAVVTSFDDTVVDEFRRIAPTVELTPGLGASSAWILARTPLPNGMRILQLPPEFSGIQVLTPDNVQASTAAGYPIWVWPNKRELENKDSYLSFLKDGITGLNANAPTAAAAAVAAFAKG